jgi:hypothetical protein
MERNCRSHICRVVLCLHSCPKLPHQTRDLPNLDALVRLLAPVMLKLINHFNFHFHFSFFEMVAKMVIKIGGRAMIGSP